MPTSSQNTNTIAMLPATTRPSMLKQNSDRYWKNRWNRPARLNGSPFGKRDLRIGPFVRQLVVHVADRVEMDARGDQRDHAEHDDRQGVDVVADRQLQLAELAERVPVAGVVAGRRIGMLVTRHRRMFVLRRLADQSAAGPSAVASAAPAYGEGEAPRTERTRLAGKRPGLAPPS